jgi:hypothetical protein
MNFSKYLDGENPSISDQMLIYTTGILIGVLLVATAKFQNLGWNVWQYIIGFTLTADLVGGVISNITKSTNSFYQKSNTLSLIFLLVHFIQPLLLTIFFGVSVSTGLFLYLFMLFSSLFVRFLCSKHYQKQTALALVTIGIIISTLYFSSPTIFSWFAGVYFLKLIYAFSVRQS